MTLGQVFSFLALALLAVPVHPAGYALSAFMPDRGQFNARSVSVDFVAPVTAGHWLVNGTELAFQPWANELPIRLALHNATPNRKAQPAADAESVVHFYLANCPQGILNVPLYRRLVVPDVYARIDWLLAIDEAGQIKYDFRLRPGADVAQIRMKFDNCQALHIAPDGSLWVQTPHGFWNDNPPTAWTQPTEPSAQRQPVPVRFRQYGPNQVGFEVGDYDRRAWLFIDPLVRIWSTFLGGKQTEMISDIKSDSINQFYLAGFTHSLDFPLSGKSFQSRSGGASDVFVAKLDAQGRRIWTTYYGGKEDDQAAALALHPQGGVAVVGTTASLRFPVSKGAFQSQVAAGNDAFVLVLDEEGQRRWATCYGGRRADEALGVACLPGGSVAVCGTTESFDLPTTPDAVQRRFQAGGSDAFLALFSPAGQLEWATFFGGHSPDYGGSLAVFQTDLYLAGTTYSTNFPVTGTSFISAPQIGAEGDAFVARLDSTGRVRWSTCLGGSHHETLTAMAIDAEGRPAIVGYTQSSDLPTSAYAPQKRGSGFTDAFAAQFSAVGEPQWSTYLGGDGHDFGYAIAHSAADQSWWIGGKSMSTAWAFDSQQEPMGSRSGRYDAFVVQLTPTGGYLWGTTLGGSNDDEIHALVPLPRQEIVLAGRTASTDFPVDPQAEQPKLAGGWDGFIGKYRFTAEIQTTGLKQPFTSAERPPDENIFTFQVKVKDVSCKGGSDGAIEVSVAGGTPPYTFKWSNGATTPNLTNLSAGSYTFTVTDAEGYTQPYYIQDAKGNYDETAKIQVKEPAQGMIVQVKGSTTNCGGGSDGRLEATVTGGQAPLVFRWSNGTNGPIAEGLVPGNYTVTVTDAKGCTAQGSGVVSDAPALRLDLTARNATCADRKDGSLIPAVTGGTPPYTYRWDDGQTTANRTNLDAGSYSLTVTDAKGCIATASANIAQPPLLILNAIPVAASCTAGNDGKIELEVSGGKPPYKFKWTSGASTQNLGPVGPGTYTVTVTDANGCSAYATAAVTKPSGPQLSLLITNPLCSDTQNGAIDLTLTGGTPPFRFNWSNGQTVEDLKSLGEGTYTVTVTDANGCVVTARADLKRPPALTLDLKYTGGGCDASAASGAVLRAVVGGGTPPHQYRWSVGGSAAELPNPAAGTYSLTVVDALGCSVTRSIEVEPASPLQVSGRVEEIACAGVASGRIDLTVTGGKEPLAYRWSNGATTPNLTGLKAGTYGVTVTDARKCAATASFSLADRQPLRAVPRIRNVSCHGGSDGAVSLAVTGGTPPYSYTWSNGLQTDQIQGLAAGNFSVEVKDSKGCSTQVKFEVKQPQILTLKIEKRDASCTAGSDGSVAVLVSGGTKPYKFSWSNGSTDFQLKNLKEGPYTVTVIDSNGCTGIASVIINRPQGFTLNLSAQDVSCAGKNDGSIALSISGGRNPFTFKWSNGSTAKDLTALSAGTYSVVVTDSAGCSASGQAVIKAPPALDIKVETTPLNCAGKSNGSLTANVSGGTAPFKFSWSTGATSDRISGLAAGSYAVTVTDAKGCTGTAKADLKAPAPLVVKVTGKNPGCDGGNTGSATAAVSGGTPPYTIRWSSGGTGEKLENLSDGRFSVSVSDAKGCEATGEVVLVRPASLSISVNVTNPGCGGANDGQAEVVISGGKEPFVVLWSNGSKERKLINLGEGNFNVSVTDGNGCKSTATAVLVRPPKLDVKLDIEALNCAGQSNGSLTANVSGGTAPFKFSWSTGATSDRISGLAAGSYAVTVTDAKGCTGTAKADLKAPAPLVVKVTGKNPGCDGGNTGSATAAVSGGTPPYTIRWSSGGTGEKLENLSDGRFSVSVSDAKGCEATGEVVLVRPASLSISVNVTNPGCGGANDGQAEVVISGGKEPFVVLWSNGSKERKLINLGEGNFNVSVTDGNGCKSTATATLVRPPKLDVKLDIEALNCAGQSNGSLTANVSGGTAPFKFSWSTGATSDRISGLAAGSYAVTVTDAKGCTGTAKADLKAPAPLVVKVTGKNPGCDGGNTGSATAAVSGGTPPYTIRWSSGGTGEKLENLSDGRFSVSVSDAKGCEATGEVVLVRPASLSISVNVTNPGCGGANDGQAEVVISGGKEPFVVLWSNGSKERKLINLGEGNFNVTVTDGNGCKSTATATLVRPPKLDVKLDIEALNCAGQSNGSLTANVSGGTAPFKFSWSTGATSDRISGLAAGSYAVTVTDAKGCTGTAKADLKAPAPLVVKVTGKNPGCDGGNTGSATAAVSGGTPPYTIRWSSGGTGEKLENLSDGRFSVSVSDAKGCEATGEVVLVRPASLSISVNVTNPGCGGANDGQAEVVISGGKEPFVVLWSNGSKERKLINLGEGNFNVSVTDGNGCKSTATATLVRPPKLDVKLDIEALNCAGQSNGSLTANVSGGTAPFKFSWSTGATSDRISGLAAGSYAVTVTDAKGCTGTAKADLKAPAPLVVKVMGKNPGCDGGNTGSATAAVSGGTPPYTIRWSSGGTGEKLENLSDGRFSVSVSDAKGCEATGEVVLVRPTPFQIQKQVTEVQCPRGKDAAIRLNIVGGTEPFVYKWSTGATTKDLTGIGAGSYSVTVSDAKGCTATAEATLQDRPMPELRAEIKSVCPGQKIDLDAGAGYKSYKWSNGSTERVLAVREPGPYSVEVVDERNCTLRLGPVNIAAGTAPTDLQIRAQGDSLIAGEAADYQWFLNNVPLDGAIRRVLVATKAGSYKVKLTSRDGCSGLSASLNHTPRRQVDESKLPKVNFYPNPTVGNITLQISNILSPLEVVIRDPSGAVVYQKNISALNSAFDESIVVRKAGGPSGTYRMTLRSKDFEEVKTIFVRD